MAQYIDKSAVVAEIERMKVDAIQFPFEEYGTVGTCNKLLSFLDTLEVKEVQEEPVSNDLEAEFVLYLKHKFNIPQEGHKLKTNGWRPSPYDILDIAKHFAQWQKEQMEKVSDNIEKELDIYLTSNGIVAADIQFEPFTQLEKCARYFFNLGKNQRRIKL